MLRECSSPGPDRKEQGDGDRRDAAEKTRLSEHLHRVLHEEMKVCADAAGRYPSNYNAWSHRIWVLQNMAPGNLKVGVGLDGLYICLSLLFLSLSSSLSAS